MEGCLWQHWLPGRTPIAQLSQFSAFSEIAFQKVLSHGNYLDSLEHNLINKVIYVARSNCVHTARSNNDKTSYGYAAAPRVSTMSFSALGNTFVKSDVNRLMSGSAFRIFLDTKALSTNLELVLDD